MAVQKRQVEASIRSSIDFMTRALAAREDEDTNIDAGQESSDCKIEIEMESIDVPIEDHDPGLIANQGKEDDIAYFEDSLGQRSGGATGTRHMKESFIKAP